MELLTKPIDVDSIRQDFPIFNRKVNNNNLIYLDSASTSQKPKLVLDELKIGRAHV